MNDKEFDRILGENLKNTTEPSTKLNLSLINEAKRCSNQTSAVADYRKSYFAAVLLLLPLAILLTLFVILFVISSVLVKIIILANMLWGILLTVFLGFLGFKLLQQRPSHIRE